MLWKLEGIVVRTIDYGEGNKIVTVYSREAGKLGVMARGAKKLNSRHGAITQLFTYGQYILFKTGTSTMGTLSSGEILESFQHVREDLEKAAHAAYIAEMVDRLTEDAEPNSWLFDQLLAAFRALEEGKDAAIVSHIMEMQLLSLAGYSPRLAQCANCGNQQGDMWLSAGEGGVLCSQCRGRDPYAQIIGPGTLKLMRLFQQVDLRRLGNVNVKPATKRQLKWAMRLLMDTHVGVNWKSRQFLDQMDKYDLMGSD